MLLGDFESSLFSHLLLMLAMHSGKMYMPPSFSLSSITGIIIIFNLYTFIFCEENDTLNVGFTECGANSIHPRRETNEI